MRSLTALVPTFLVASLLMACDSSPKAKSSRSTDGGEAQTDQQYDIYGDLPGKLPGNELGQCWGMAILLQCISEATVKSCGDEPPVFTEITDDLFRWMTSRNGCVGKELCSEYSLLRGRGKLPLQHPDMIDAISSELQGTYANICAAIPKAIPKADYTTIVERNTCSAGTLNALSPGQCLAVGGPYKRRPIDGGDYSDTGGSHAVTICKRPDGNLEVIDPNCTPNRVAQPSLTVTDGSIAYACGSSHYSAIVPYTCERDLIRDILAEILDRRKSSGGTESPMAP